jgi:hypothetical protein
MLSLKLIPCYNNLIEWEKQRLLILLAQRKKQHYR